MFEEIGDLWGVGTTMHSMCRLRTLYDHYEDAGDLFERTLEAVERVGDDLGISLALVNLATASMAAGDVEATRAVIRRLVDHMSSTGITYAGDGLLDLLAWIESADGEYERAVELLASADRLREQLGTPLWPPARKKRESFMEELRTAMGDEAFDAAYERGTTLDPGGVRETARRVAAMA